jgi:hypothetical protein
LSIALIVIFRYFYLRKKFMRFKKLVPIVGVCAVSFLSSSAMAAGLWAVNCAQQQMCLDARTDNRQAQVSRCDYSGNTQAQKWIQNEPTGGNIKNAFNINGQEQCLDMSDPVNGRSNVYVSDCSNGGDAQGWIFQVQDNAGEIKNKWQPTHTSDTSGNYCLEAQEYNVVGISCNGENSQKWYWVDGEPTGNQISQGCEQDMPLSASLEDAKGQGKGLCSIDPIGPCLADYNFCGQSSGCTCPLGYTYNKATGKCDWSFEFEACAAR